MCAFMPLLACIVAVCWPVACMCAVERDCRSLQVTRHIGAGETGAAAAGQAANVQDAINRATNKHWWFSQFHHAFGEIQRLRDDTYVETVSPFVPARAEKDAQKENESPAVGRAAHISPDPAVVEMLAGGIKTPAPAPRYAERVVPRAATLKCPSYATTVNNASSQTCRRVPSSMVESMRVICVFAGVGEHPANPGDEEALAGVDPSPPATSIAGDSGGPPKRQRMGKGHARDMEMARQVGEQRSTSVLAAAQLKKASALEVAGVMIGSKKEIAEAQFRVQKEQLQIALARQQTEEARLVLQKEHQQTEAARLKLEERSVRNTLRVSLIQSFVKAGLSAVDALAPPDAEMKKDADCVD